MDETLDAYEQYDIKSNLDLTESREYEFVHKDSIGFNDRHSITNTPDFSSRQMSCTQEILNALTMIPTTLYCMYVTMSGSWINEKSINFAQKHGCENASLSADEYDVSMISLLPLPVLAIVLGVFIHFPFSFYYHWQCAKHIPPGYGRISHITRRLDHAFIHVASALYSYGTSGNIHYFLLCAIYNADCVYRQLEKEVSISL